MDGPHQLPKLYPVFPKDGSEGATTVDIIAVHGIETCSPRTWIAYERAQNPRGRATNWLCDEDMLPSVIPEAQIWMFDYNSNYSESAQTVHVRDLGETFLTFIEHNKKLGSRPLVFVGSCFGGLVVAQALERASRERSLCEQLLSNTVGVIFLGTPLRGTAAWKAAEWRVMLSTILRREPSSTLIKDLAESSSRLEGLVEDFGKMTIREGLQVRCFYETRPTQIFNAVLHKRIPSLLRFSEKPLVEKSSACLDCHDHIPLDVRHVMMNKFSGPQDGSFQLVSGCMKKMFDNAPVINIPTAEERDCLQMLASNYREDKDRNVERVPNTCQWFLEHPKFDSWRKEKSANLLWVSADPGCGKSVLSRALVDESLLSTDTKGPSTCYFFFRDDNANRQHGANALCAILHQLFTQKPMLLRYAMPDFVTNGQVLHTMFKTLWEILQKAAADPQAGGIVCLMDALNECQESSREDLINWMGNFYLTQNQTVTRLKFLVTSRLYFDIEGAFSATVKDLPSISLRGEDESEKISKEINLVIDAKIPHISRQRRYLLPSEVQNGLIVRLKSIEHRTYLWLHLILDVIKKAPDSTKARLSKLLDTIPCTVDEAYERILSKATDPQARTLLSIIVAAIRLLTLREMNVALAIDERLESGEQCRSFNNLDLELEEPFQDKVRNLCGLFVRVVDSKIYLIHQTAKEFLVSKKLIDKPVSCMNHELKPWKHSLSPIHSNLILAKICISLLNFDEFKHPFIDHESDMNVDEHDVKFTDNETNMNVHEFDDELTDHEIEMGFDQYSDEDTDDMDFDQLHEKIFLEYAAEHWVTHFRIVQNIVDQSLLNLAFDICDPQSSHFGNWFQIYWCYSESVPEHPERLTILIVASFLGLEALVKLLLEKNDINVDTKDEGGKSALSRAAEQGHLEVVKWLPWKRVDLDSADTYGRTPLLYAVIYAHLEIVNLLLQEGAEQNRKDNEGRTPLLVAAQNGHLQVVKTLIQKGAELDCKDIYGQTPLLRAAEHGHLEVVKELVQKGAELNLGDRHDQTPLLRAAEHGHLEVVKELIQKGAELDCKDKHGQTPLFIAAQHGHSKVVNALLQMGAELDCKNVRGQTLLYEAAQQGQSEFVRVLIQKGAELDCKDIYGQTPLLRAAEHGHLEVVKELIQKGAELDCKDKHGQTPLFIAAQHGHSKVVNALLQMGAELDCKDGYGRTPLSEAAQRGHPEVVNALVQEGAECNFKDKEGRNPLSYAAEYGYLEILKLLLQGDANPNSKDKGDQTPLSYAAARYGSLKAIELLLQKGAEVDSKDKKDCTPLSRAVQYGNSEVVKLLLQKGAECDFKDNEGRTPLCYAAASIYGVLEVVKLLLQEGAERNSKDKDGRTPLSHAVNYWVPAGIAQMLLQEGAEPESKDKDGRTPLSYAAGNRNLEALKLLLQGGANPNSKDEGDRTPLSYAAAWSGNVEIVKLLLQEAAEPDLKDKEGRTALSYATEAHNKANNMEVIELLQTKPASRSR